MRKILPYIIVLSLFINFCFSDSFFKTEEGCEFWTSHTDAQKLTWDGACKNGRVDGKGKLIIYKNNEIFYEYNGRVINGYPKNGTIEWNLKTDEMFYYDKNRKKKIEYEIIERNERYIK